MGGHSHWSTIKRQKGASDAKRGQLFTKLSREITVSAREGGGDPTMNPRLRLAIDKARESNMPADTIKRGIERGAGGGDAAALVETTFEGYGPAGVAIILQVVTDNRNRTVSEIRTTLARNGGSLGARQSYRRNWTSWCLECRRPNIEPAHVEPAAPAGLLWSA